MKKLLYTIVVFFLLVSVGNAATYTAYFADDGTDDIVGTWDATECTEGDPCNTLTEAQQVIDDLSSSDTVTLYFAKGDTWTENTDAVVLTLCFGLTIADDDPVTHINSYGTGAKPIFDGTVADFSSVPDHNPTTGPLSWSRFFTFQRDGCSIKNIKINGVYGQAIAIGTVSNPADNITIEACDITGFGDTGLKASIYYGTRNTTITKCLIHTGGQLYKEGKIPSPGWGIGIALAPSPSSTRDGYGNTVSYNVMYDIAGEGIHSCFGTVEYNVVGDTGSVAIYVNPFENDAYNTVVRYNLVMMSDWSSSDYDNLADCTPDGIVILDEASGGSNAGATVQIYGNIVINRKHGIWFSDTYGDAAWAGIRIFNNTVIDSHNDGTAGKNYTIAGYDNVAVGQGFVYNNTSILYNQTTSTHALDQDDPASLSTYWTIDNNAFWTTGGSPSVDADWQTNYVVTDPKLNGESTPVDWDGQSGATYFSDIEFSDLYPLIGSSLIGAGKTLSTYEKTFLTLGTDFGDLPATQTFATSEQSDLVAYDIGAAIRSLSYGFNVNDGDTGVSVTTDLSWTNQGDTTGVNVYFDAGSCPIGVPTKVIDNSLETTYDPTLTVNTTYCYTVDPINSLGETEAGKDIEFTTTGGPPAPSAQVGVLKFHKNASIWKYHKNAGQIKK